MKKISLLAALLSFCFLSTGLAQSSILQQETILKVIGDSILHGNNDSVRNINSNIFLVKMEELLRNEASFSYPFDSLKNVSIVTSSDKTLRVYTWLLPSITKNKFNYFGFLQVKDKKTKKVSLHKLTEGTIIPEELEKKSLPCENWFGALYYKIIENKAKGKIYYTLLGWRGNSLKTTIKIIDALSINKDAIKFGAPVFKSEKGMKHRIVFEYTAQAVMSLRYNEKKKMIVFDHLSPSNPALKGNYEYYGPDMTYDGYKFKNNSWYLTKNIEIGNPSESDPKKNNVKIKNKDFYNPEK